MVIEKRVELKRGNTSCVYIKKQSGIPWVRSLNHTMWLWGVFNTKRKLLVSNQQQPM